MLDRMATDKGVPKEELRSLIERYRAEWERVLSGRGDVDELNIFFHLPCIFVGADGSAALLRAAPDISGFHRPRLDLFQKGGVATPRNRDFDVVQMGRAVPSSQSLGSYVGLMTPSSDRGGILTTS
jgi:hypothetical protein